MDDITDLFDAIEAGDLATVQALLGRAPALVSARDAMGLSPILRARYSGKTEIANVIAGIGIPLDHFDAAAMGDVARLRALIDISPELANSWSADGFSILGYAAFFGGSGVVQLLLERGADVNAASRNPMRVAPLHSAAAVGDIESLRLLLALGADPNARQQGGFTALAAAAHAGNVEMIDLILRAGGLPGIANDDGETPLTLAEAGGHLHAVERLRSADG